MAKAPARIPMIDHAVAHEAEIDTLRYLVRTLANHLECVTLLLPASAADLRASTERLVSSARAVVDR